MVKKCHPCQVYTRKMWTHSSPLFLVITVDPFPKWGIYFTTCNQVLAKGHKYIIVPVDYFTKWVKYTPTFNNDGDTRTPLMFIQIISRFHIA